MNERDPVLKKVVHVTVLIDCMMRETSKAHANIDHATDWMVHHDALNQIADKDTRAWMKQQTLQGKTYWERLIGPFSVSMMERDVQTG